MKAVPEDAGQRQRGLVLFGFEAFQLMGRGRGQKVVNSGLAGVLGVDFGLNTHSLVSLRRAASAAISFGVMVCSSYARFVRTRARTSDRRKYSVRPPPFGPASANRPSSRKGFQ